MQPLKETKVYMPTLENDFDVAGTTIKNNRLIGLKEQTGYFLTKQEMEELLKKLWDEGWDSYHNETGLQHPDITRDTYINKLLNNE